MSAPTIICPVCGDWLGSNIESHYWEHRLKLLAEEDYVLATAEAKGILRLASRFRGKAKTPLTGLEMAKKVQLEADKLIRQLGLTPAKERLHDTKGSDLASERSGGDDDAL